jgi:hypothetical protein
MKELVDSCIDYIYFVLKHNSNDFTALLESDTSNLATCLEIVKDFILSNKFEESPDTLHVDKINELSMNSETKNKANKRQQHVPFRWGK